VTELSETAIAVVGGGPAGIAAACRAAESGAEVCLIDEAPAPGGQIWKRGSRRPTGPARRWLARLSGSGARVIGAAQIVLAEPEPAGGGHRLTLETADRPGEPQTLRSRCLVLATGARERFLPFPGWTLPGVVGVGAAQSLAKSGASFRGRRVLVAGSGPLLLPAAASLSAGGARVEAVAEQAGRGRVLRFLLSLTARPGRLLQAALYRSRFLCARYRTGTWVAEARGDECLREVVLTDGARSWTLPCEVLCCGYGLVPNIELPALLGCELERGGARVGELQQSSIAGIFCAGEVTGIGGVDLALVEGEIAGLAAAGRRQEARRLLPRRSRCRAFARALEKAFALRPELASLARPETVVCRCEDVKLSEIDASWSRRQAKLHARAGMGPCQGRVCGPALDFLFGVGADSARPPVRPVPLSSFLSERSRG
jgi:NADPH-dependent 2,4-dienoyl-CoA reductase/sulfur reductase-like enzyme